MGMGRDGPDGKERERERERDREGEREREGERSRGDEHSAECGVQGAWRRVESGEWRVESRE
jgi:hypothetical protein